MARNPYWPAFESHFLDEVAGSLRKRSKALRHKCSNYGCERVWEIQEGLRREKAEISIKLLGAQPVRLSCHLWDDRWTWIDARQPTKAGWRFEWRHEGRIGSTDPRGVAEAIEQSLAVDFADVDHVHVALSGIWRPIAVSGPIRAI